MKINLINKNQNIIKIYLNIYWIVIIGSIGGYYDLLNDNINTTNIRTILPLFFLTISFIFLYQRIVTNISKYIVLQLFFILNILYLFGQNLHYGKLIIPDTTLVLQGFAALIFLISSNYLSKDYEYYLKIFLVIILGVYVIYTFLIFKDYFNNTSYWLYSYSLNDVLLNTPTPRITGTARSLSILFLFATIYFFFKEKKILNFIFAIIFLYVISFVLWGLQSRGAFLCLFISLLLIFFIYKKKIEKILCILIIIFLGAISFNEVANNKNFLKKKINSQIDSQKESIIAKQPTRVLKNNNISSGRLLIWNALYQEYNFKNIFGYGIQADRYLLRSFNPTFTNASNGFIYSFISGGYLAFICLLVIFLINIKYMRQYYFQALVKNKFDFFGLLSFLIILFFSVRIFFENSFALFSIDFLLYILSSLIIKQKLTTSLSQV